MEVEAMRMRDEPGDENVSCFLFSTANNKPQTTAHRQPCGNHSDHTRLSLFVVVVVVSVGRSVVVGMAALDISFSSAPGADSLSDSDSESGSTEEAVQLPGRFDGVVEEKEKEKPVVKVVEESESESDSESGGSTEAEVEVEVERKSKTADHRKVSVVLDSSGSESDSEEEDGGAGAGVPISARLEASLDKRSKRLSTAAMLEAEEADAGSVKCAENASGQAEISLESRGLTSVPPEVFKIRRVEVLRLGNNAIKEIPSSISKLSALTFLDVTSNKLETLPEEMAGLYNMQVVHGSQNPRLGSAMSAIACMDNLTHLQLNEVGLDVLPDNISRLIRLRQLHLNNNSLTEFNPEVFKLSALMDLSVDNNNIATIPKSVSGLRSLTALDIANNALVDLPVELGGLESLQELRIDGNPLSEKSLLSKFEDGGNEAVLDHLKAKAANGGGCCVVS